MIKNEFLTPNKISHPKIKKYLRSDEYNRWLLFLNLVCEAFFFLHLSQFLLYSEKYIF